MTASKIGINTFSHILKFKRDIETSNSGKQPVPINGLSDSFIRNQYLNMLLEWFHINTILITKAIKNTLTLITFHWNVLNGASMHSCSPTYSHSAGTYMECQIGISSCDWFFHGTPQLHLQNTDIISHIKLWPLLPLFHAIYCAYLFYPFWSFT